MLLTLDLVLSFIFCYQPKHTFVLDRTLFAQVLVTTPHLSSDGQYGMIYEHLLGCFILEDSSSRFSKLFQVVVVVAHGDIPRLVALVLGVSKMLAMAKDIGGLCPIVVGKTFHRFINCSIVL
jgi:hypothetical protein